MKAVKLNKIQWMINNLSDEEKANAIKTLPVVMAFTVQDTFNVIEKVPAILKKKYGYDVDTFSYTECRIVDNIDDLLHLNAPRGKETKALWTAGGRISAFGEECKKTLESNVKYRIQLERKGTSPYDMPKILDEVMLGIEKISGLSWEDHTPEELMTPIYRKIWEHKACNLKDEFEADED